MAPSRTPFCSVCMQAGKPKSEYSTHYTMSEPGPRGVVVCPYLLSLECRYCHELGHTPKYCPKAKSNNDRRAWRQAAAGFLERAVDSPKTPIRPRLAHIPQAPKKLKPANLFDCLDDDIEGDEDNDRMKMFKVEKKAEKIEEFPSLGKKVKKGKKSKNPEAVLSTTSWAQITNHKPVDDCVLSAAPKQEERNLEQERLDIEQAFMVKRADKMADKIIEKMQSNTHTSDDAWNESSFGGPLRTYGLDDDYYWGDDNNTSHMGDDECSIETFW